jgi:hypothetical protein
MYECSVCKENYPDDTKVPAFKTERGLALHKSKTHQLTARDRVVEAVDDVRNFQDVIKFAIHRLGCDWPAGEDWKRSAIILSYSGYDAKDLAQTIEWCANTGKRFDLPWKAIVWVDQWREEKGSRLFSGAVDPVQARLDALYTTADGQLRKRIRAVSNNPDKREALELLREMR